MRRAIELAKKGCGYTNPNPLVGAVIVKDQRVIGEGYHEKIGGLHAERNALKNCIEDPEARSESLHLCGYPYPEVTGTFCRVP